MIINVSLILFRVTELICLRITRYNPRGNNWNSLLFETRLLNERVLLICRRASKWYNSCLWIVDFPLWGLNKHKQAELWCKWITHWSTDPRDERIIYCSGWVTHLVWEVCKEHAVHKTERQHFFNHNLKLNFILGFYILFADGCNIGQLIKQWQ